MEYEHTRFTRRCAVTGRELRAGELIYSVLVAEGGNLVRQDYSAEAWPGAPAGAVGWWKSRVEDTGKKPVRWAPNDVMLDLLEQLACDPSKADVRYVLALLLVRRRVCRLETPKPDEEPGTLRIYCPRREQEYRVAIAAPNTERAKEIQEELAKLLFAA
jgi:hypothetical protein